jgi:sortase (surface protein transpeptidase)
MTKFKPRLSGEVKVKSGRRVIWLARPSRLSISLTMGGFVLIVLGLIAAGVPIVPMVWYSIKQSTPSDLAQILDKSVVDSGQITYRAIDYWQPEVDMTLPLGGWINIPSIKVNTKIYEEPSERYEEALKKGVWRVPELGTPMRRTIPTILVAHRFGYLKWSNTYRRDNSFYNLPKVKVGDQVEIDWGQRRYVYEVYAGDEGTEITDYSADLILYSCQYLESDQRIFKYARLVK